MITAVVFLVLCTVNLLLGISTVNINAAAGFYGAEPADISYTMLAFYAGLASFGAVERRLATHLPVKPYLLIAFCFLTLLSLASYVTPDIHWLFVYRFMQGLCCNSIVNISLALLFASMRTERSREIGFSIFYGLLLVLAPLAAFITTGVVDDYNFNAVYLVGAALPVPGILLLYCMLENGYLAKRKQQLYQLEWHSFILFSMMLLAVAYLCVYGQQEEWFDSARIRCCVAVILLLLVVHAFRQRSLKRPFLHIEVWIFRNFRIGLLLITMLYLARGGINVSLAYFTTVAGMDPMQCNTMMLANVAGAVTGVFVASRMLLALHHIRMMLFQGFGLMMVFYGWMYFLFSAQAEPDSFIIPLFLHGAGAGLLITPVVLFTVSSVPPQLSASAALTGMSVRFLGTSISLGLISHFQLALGKLHYDKIIPELTTAAPLTRQRISLYEQVLQRQGLSLGESAKVAVKLLEKQASGVSYTRFAMDYYFGMAMLMAVMLVLVFLLPLINKTWIEIKNKSLLPSV